MTDATDSNTSLDWTKPVISSKVLRVSRAIAVLTACIIITLGGFSLFAISVRDDTIFTENLFAPYPQVAGEQEGSAQKVVALSQVMGAEEGNRDLSNWTSLHALEAAVKEAADQGQQIPSQYRPRLAYAYYATDQAYGCAALVGIHSVQQTNISKEIDILFIYIPNQVPQAILDKAKAMGAKLHAMQTPFATQDGYYRDVFLKLTVFQLTIYDRVLIMDADSVVMKNLDHLFYLPHTPVASPHAIWLENAERPVIITSILLVIEPSQDLWANRIKPYFDQGFKEFDMDLVNYEFYMRERKDGYFLPGLYGCLDGSLEFWINEEKIPGLGSIDPLLRRGLDVMMAQQSAGDPFWAGKERLLFFDAVDNHVTSVPLMKVDEAFQGLRALPELHQVADDSLRQFLTHLRKSRLESNAILTDCYLIHFTHWGSVDRPWIWRWN